MSASRSAASLSRSLIVAVSAALVVTSSGLADQNDARPVARIVKVKNSATIQEPGNTRQRAAKVYGTVYENERVRVPDESLVVLSFRGHGYLELVRGPCTVTATRAGCRGECRCDGDVEKITVNGKQGRLKTKGIRRLSRFTKGGAVVARGDPPQLAPIVGSTIVDQTPELAWPEVEKAVEYHLVLKRPFDNRDSCTQRTEKNEYQIPDRHRLKRDTTYVWTVSVRDANGRMEETFHGTFRVASTETMTAAREFRSLASSKNEAVLALVGWGYARLRLDREAIRTYERLMKISESPAQYHSVLASLYQKAGRIDAAKKLSP